MPDNVYDTVLRDTPAARATSPMVVTPTCFRPVRHKMKGDARLIKPASMDLRVAITRHPVTLPAAGRFLQPASREEGAVGALVLGGEGKSLGRGGQGVLLDDQPPRPAGVAQDGEEGVDIDIPGPKPRERLA